MLRFHSLTTWPLTFAAGCAALMMLVTPSAQASAWDKKTAVDFSQPVEVPGAVLPPGKYVMKLVDVASARNVLEITNERENHVYSTSFTIPVYRSQPTDRTVLTFYEAPAGQPQALKAWYYPGDALGRQFVYPKGRGVQLAGLTGAGLTGQALIGQSNPARSISEPGRNAFSTNTAPPPAPTAPSAPAAEPAAFVPQATATQAGPVEVAQADPQRQAQSSDTSVQSSSNSSTADNTLPKTAGSLPSVVLLGVLAIGGALGFRRIRGYVA